MAERRDTTRRDPSGTAGGTDIEPLRGGMREQDEKSGGVTPDHGASPDRERRTGAPKPEHAPEHEPEHEPAAPYHGVRVAEAGLAPRREPNEGAPVSETPGEIDDTAGRKIAQEQGEVEREGGNAPRDRRR